MDFSKVTEYVNSVVDEIGVPSVDMIVCRDHEQLYRYMAGHRDTERKERLQGNETYNLYSATKVITTCAEMQLIEQGKLSLDDPVSKYLPAYAHLTVKDGDGARPAERVMTVRHLMSMQSGLNYDAATPPVKKLLEETGGMADTRQLVEAKAQDPLEFEPGTNFLYSLSHDVLAAVIETASGMRFSEYLKKHIFAPLGMETIGFQLAEKDWDRQCAQYVFNGETKAFDAMDAHDLSYRFTPAYESGGAGLISDVKDYITFADAIACGGVSKDGARILSPQMIQLWSANQLGPASRKSFDAWNRKGYSYALGVRTRVDISQGGRGSVGEFGWDGAACAYAAIDPHTHLSVFVAMHVRNFGYAYDVIHPKLRDLVYGALEE
ncbi:MAG: beta-lactamase family protein [Clostridia bacterium]|nr:beta-lactamase family protein [Clostridia bacterium]